MPKRAKRIVIDTNLWISYLITQDYEWLDAAILGGRIRVVFSDELLSEFGTVVKRPKFRKYFSLEQIEKLIETFEVYGEWVDVKTQVSRCRDAKDNFLLALAQDAEADFLVTGDKDLLDLETHLGTRIVTIQSFATKVARKL